MQQIYSNYYNFVPTKGTKNIATRNVSWPHQRLDFGNFTLVRLPAYLQQQLQSVLNAAARLVFRLRRYDHITDALAVLHFAVLH